MKNFLKKAPRNWSFEDFEEARKLYWCFDSFMELRDYVNNTNFNVWVKGDENDIEFICYMKVFNASYVDYDNSFKNNTISESCYDYFYIEHDIFHNNKFDIRCTKKHLVIQSVNKTFIKQFCKSVFCN